jgi:solute carrier family 13 (sodium-dependent dicarboxylate transporter), member 2/3/5
MTYETRMDLCDPHPNLLKLKLARLRLDLSGCLHLEGTRSRHRMSSAEWLAQHRSESESPNTLAYFIMLRVGITYPRILLGLILTDFLLTFVVPSGIARVVIMASIALGLAEAFKSGPGSNVSRGMFLILSYTANIFDKMIIAGAGSITARGLIEKVGGVEVLWSYWFVAFLPCTIITVLAAWWLTLWLYPPEKVALEGGYAYLRTEIEKMGSWSALEKNAAPFRAGGLVPWYFGT